MQCEETQQKLEIVPGGASHGNPFVDQIPDSRLAVKQSDVLSSHACEYQQRWRAPRETETVELCRNG